MKTDAVAQKSRIDTIVALAEERRHIEGMRRSKTRNKRLLSLSRKYQRLGMLQTANEIKKEMTDVTPTNRRSDRAVTLDIHPPTTYEDSGEVQ